MNVTKVGIVGLGRWAKVLTRAASKSQTLKIVSAYSRSHEKRDAFTRELGVAAVPDLATMLADPAIEGVILTVPNEQHLPLALEVGDGEAFFQRAGDRLLGVDMLTGLGHLACERQVLLVRHGQDHAFDLRIIQKRG